MTMKALSIGGREVQLDFRAWGDRQRHFGSVVVLVAVAVVLVVGLALHLLVRSVADTVLWVLIVLVLGLLVYEAGAVYYGLRKPRSAAIPDDDDAEAAVAAEGGDAAPAAFEGDAAAAWQAPAAGDAPTPAGPQVLTLRCGECQTVFDVEDHGARPLYHVCPGCGAEGVLTGDEGGADEEEWPSEEAAPAHDHGAADAAPAADAADEVDADARFRRPPEAAEPPAEPAAEAPPAAPAAPPAPAGPQIKLRCGACKHVFTVEDTGERPLRTRCPACSKLGEIR